MSCRPGQGLPRSVPRRRGRGRRGCRRRWGRFGCGEAIAGHADDRAAAELPQHADRLHTARHAAEDARQAVDAYTEAAGRARRLQTIRDAATGHRDLASDLPILTAQALTAQQRLAAATSRVQQLTADPAIATHPDRAAILAGAHTSWTLNRAAQRAAQAARQADQAAQPRRPGPDGPAYPGPTPTGAGPASADDRPTKAGVRCWSRSSPSCLCSWRPQSRGSTNTPETASPRGRIIPLR